MLSTLKGSQRFWHPAGVGSLWRVFPVVSLADSLNHRLRCWHPYGMAKALSCHFRRGLKLSGPPKFSYITVPSEAPKRMRSPGTRETLRPEEISTCVPAGEMLVQVWPEVFFNPQTSGRFGCGTISAQSSE